MKALVVYSSRTGNTKMVAEAISDLWPSEAAIYPVAEAPPADGYHVVVLGFWVNRGRPDEAALAYMKEVRNQEVGLFGTLGAQPDSDHARECMAEAVELMEKNGNRVRCRFMCMGKVDTRIIEAMQRDPETAKRHPMTDERRARLAEAAKHPDQDDLAAARRVFAEAFAS